jgi:hypothetical protein
MIIPPNISPILKPKTPHQSELINETTPKEIINKKIIDTITHNPTTRFDITKNSEMLIDEITHTTRMQLRIPLVIKGFQTQWTIIEKTQSVIQKLLDIDNSIVIIPWKANNDEQSNDSYAFLPITEITGRSQNLETYFPRINQQIKPNDNFIWIDFRMQHNAPWEHLKNGIAARL